MTTTCEADPVDAGDFCFFLLSLSPEKNALNDQGLTCKSALFLAE